VKNTSKHAISKNIKLHVSAFVCVSNFYKIMLKIIKNAINQLIFKWDEVETLDNEPSYNKKLISEIVHIKGQSWFQ